MFVTVGQSLFDQWIRGVKSGSVWAVLVKRLELRIGDGGNRVSSEPPTVF